ncbi:hypothetical protein KFL_002180020 [Klebsormidium nitens]|uniref:Uncharacterized protein n=1 Tax=Klebsormidium nitens TaxID=105231 RepID=A0A1Y1I8J3_KLENI|nr:hypothetical protein KFL_002180020 [Klebsormidium nitens]|eukprot:GAQ85027.1 hypothetical protein KFL_002180020 [Klebsormidium nitens]
MAELWEQFFQIADADRDGKISGGEAVAFFQKSGLPQMTLAKIWQIADQGQTGFLDRREFNAALKLVTVAQSGRDLTPDIARMVLTGAGPQIPPPRIAGLTPPGPQSGPPQGPPPSQQSGGFQRPGSPSQSAPPAGFGNDAFGAGAGFSAARPAEPLKPAASTSSYGSAGSGDFASAAGSFQGGKAPAGARPVSAPGVDVPPAGGRAGQPQAPASFQGGFNASALAPYSGGAPPQGPASQPRGAGFAPSATPPQSAGGVAPPQGSYAAQPWPRMTPQDAQRYMQVFTSVDTDRDQKITGEQARDLFLSWGIPREILKQIWDLSDQDQDGMLSVREFCTALYLMEKSREGRPLPPVLPTGIHIDEPPLDPRAQIAAQQIAAAQAAIADTQHAPWAAPGGSAMLGVPTPSPPVSTKPPRWSPPKRKRGMRLRNWGRSSRRRRKRTRAS